MIFSQLLVITIQSLLGMKVNESNIFRSHPLLEIIVYADSHLMQQACEIKEGICVLMNFNLSLLCQMMI